MRWTDAARQKIEAVMDDRCRDDARGAIRTGLAAEPGPGVERKTFGFQNVTPRSMPAPVSPALVVLSILAGSYVALFLAAAVLQVPVRLIDYSFLGLDFADFWTAAGDALAGNDPYARARFVTPPLSLLPFLPLAFLPRPVATLVFLCCNGAALAVGIGWLIAAFRLSKPQAVVVALVCSLSSATIFLLERGNLDGLVFLTLCAFMALNGRRALGPVALAIASCLKIYPAVFGLMLAAQGRWRATLIFGGVVLVALLLTPSGDLAFLHNQAVRAHGMRINENLSGLSLFWSGDVAFFGDAAGSSRVHPMMAIGVGLYGAALAFCLWCDAKKVGHLSEPDRRLLLASYVAFCVSLPSLVYLYSGVCLFILLVALEQDGLSDARGRMRTFALGLGLAMLPARSFDLTLATPWSNVLNVLPPLGSLLLVVEAVRLRSRLCFASASRGKVDRRVHVSLTADPIACRRSPAS